MTLRRTLLFVFTLALLPSTAFASKKEVEAASMIERARQLSDIRAEGSPPFRLTLNFKAIKEDGTLLEGTYKEIWASKTQWRRETVIGDFRRIEVAANQQRWLLESRQSLPEHVRNLPALSALGRFQPEAWKPEKIENRKLNGTSVRCVETAPDVRAGWHAGTGRDAGRVGGSPALCFDTSSGVLVAEIEPNKDTSCFFSDYEKFGERVLARSYQCIKDGNPTLDGKIVELVTDSNPDTTSFALSGGVKERTSCPDPINPPRVIYQPQPVAPAGSGLVVITTTIGIDGAPRDLVTQSSPNRNLEKAALEAVRQWRFKPATCDGEPVNAKIAVEVDVHIQ